MNQDKIRSIVRYLSEPTGRGQVAWKVLSENEFQVDFGGSSIVTGLEGYGPYLNILNRDGARIVSIDTTNIETFGMPPDVLIEIYSRAENQILRIEETLDDILNNLKNPEDRYQ